MVSLRGYPAWPGEVIPQRSVKKVLPSSIACPPGKSGYGAYLPIQYFGALNYGWAKENAVTRLIDHKEEDLRAKKKAASYQEAITQAFDMVKNPKDKPIGWWNGPKPPPVPEFDAGREADASAEAPERKERNAPHKGVARRMRNVPWPSKKDLWYPTPNVVTPFVLPEMLVIRAKPRYETLRRNLYSGSENGSQHKPKKVPKHDILVCACAPGKGCGSELVSEQEMCMNFRMNVRCCHTQCPNGKQCQNKEFNLMKPRKLKAFLTESCGWGVKTKEKIPKGAFVIEYAGEIIHDAECEKRMWEAKKIHERNFYMMEISGNCVIDARHKANLSRLINSSCHPNCRSQKCVDAATGEVRVGIFALRDIEPGEELSYNYQFQHFAHGEKDVTSFDCRCGAPNCIGTLDSTVKKREEVKEYMNKKIKIKWTDGKDHIATVTDYNWKTQKYTITYEDGNTEDLSLDPNGKIKFKFIASRKKRQVRPKQEPGCASGSGGGEPQQQRASKPKKQKRPHHPKSMARPQAAGERKVKKPKKEAEDNKENLSQNDCSPKTASALGSKRVKAPISPTVARLGSELDTRAMVNGM
ncbi:histone methyltransferase [Chloropicon primus]|uniref:Histone methyltransferase n=2 Tax=Chloropicon primus TaxID=1764295 RepID=A0A5B8MZA6_9CHLO|nr:histone methyltransferase [Chloropicon primus]UPR04080.1 histone methyltransferase [Chloropicon primus]|eukprot:QDZ24870.1 histone methyltransferase [Chloropicon primus]